MRQLYTFVIRILHDDDDQAMHGQISEPVSDDEWRASFANASELWAKLKQRVAKRPRSSDDQQRRTQEKSE